MLRQVIHHFLGQINTVFPYEETEIGSQYLLPGIGRQRVLINVTSDETRYQIRSWHRRSPGPENLLGNISQVSVANGDAPLIPLGVTGQGERIVARFPRGPTFCSRMRSAWEMMGMPKAKDLPEPVPVETTVLGDWEIGRLIG